MFSSALPVASIHSSINYFNCVLCNWCEYFHLITLLFTIQFVPKEERPPLPQLPDDDHDIPTLTRNLSFLSQASTSTVAGDLQSSQHKATQGISSPTVSQPFPGSDVFFAQMKRLIAENSEEKSKKTKSGEHAHIDQYLEYIKSILLKCDTAMRHEAQHAITNIVERIETKMEYAQKNKHSPFEKQHRRNPSDNRSDEEV